VDLLESDFVTLLLTWSYGPPPPTVISAARMAAQVISTIAAKTTISRRL
jgi:hypothetical protein